MTTHSFLFECGCGRFFAVHRKGQRTDIAQTGCPSCGATCKSSALLCGETLPVQDAAPDIQPAPKKRLPMHVNKVDRDHVKVFGDRRGQIR